MASSHDRMRWRREGVTVGVWEQLGTASAVDYMQGRSSQRGSTGSVALRAEGTHLGHGEDLGNGNTLHLYNGGPYMVMCIFPNHQTVYGNELCGGKAIPQDAHFGSH